MKKVLIIFIVSLGLLFVNNTMKVNAEEINNDEYVSRYETWG